MAKVASKQIASSKIKNGIEWWMYLPQIVAFGYVPLLVHVHTYYRPLLAEQVWFPDGIQTDFFLAYKAFGIVACGFCALVVFLASLPQYPFKKNKIYIPLAVYALMVFLSGTISPYRSLAWAGSFESFESVPVVLSYCIICFTTAHLISHDGMRGVKIIAYGALPGIFTLMLIGAFQYFGMDFFKTEIGQRLILGNLYGQMDLKFNLPERQVYTTLYNPDFVGAYFSVMTPFLVCFSFIAEKIWLKVVLWVGVVLSLINVIGSGTSTVWVVFVCELGFGIILWGFSNRHFKRGMITTGALMIIGIACVVGVLSNQAFRENVKRELMSSNDEIEYSLYTKDIYTTNNGVKYVYDEGSILISYEIVDNKIDISVKDERGNDIDIVNNRVNDWYIVHLSEWDIGIAPVNDTENEIKYIILSDDQRGFKFINYDGEYYLINDLWKLESFPNGIKKSSVFIDSFASGRGLIWNLTIPKMGNYIILGSGAGTYIMEYPQSDYKYTKKFSLDVKPHSFYLQQWIENGLISLVFIFIFLIWVIYICSQFCVVININYINKQNIIVGLSLLCIVGFILSGIVNDSIIVYGIVFWCIVGTGIGMLIKNECIISIKN